MRPSTLTDRGHASSRRWKMTNRRCADATPPHHGHPHISRRGARHAGQPSGAQPVTPRTEAAVMELQPPHGKLTRQLVCSGCGAKYRVDPHQFRIIRMKIVLLTFHGSKGHGPRRRRGSRYASFVGSVSEHDRDLGADHRHFVNSSSSAALSAQSSDVAFYWINQLGACRSAGAVGRCRYGWRSLPRISLLPD
jgi:hypothetical protein